MPVMNIRIRPNELPVKTQIRMTRESVTVETTTMGGPDWRAEVIAAFNDLPWETIAANYLVAKL